MNFELSNPSNIQPVTLNLSSPTVNSTRSGPLTGSTDYSSISPRTDLTSPDSAASLYQRRAPQLTPGRDDTMCHYSPGGPVPKGDMSGLFSAIRASLFQISNSRFFFLTLKMEPVEIIYSGSAGMKTLKLVKWPSLRVISCRIAKSNVVLHTVVGYLYL